MSSDKTSFYKVLAVILVLAMILILILFLNQRFSASQEQIISNASSMDANTPSSTIGNVATSTSAKYTWKFVEAALDGEAELPMTDVGLQVEGGSFYDLGKQDGTCFIIENSAWDLLPNENTGAICWWAGGGVEFGVFEENGKLLLKKGVVEEGDGETEGFRGDFRVVPNVVL